MPEHVLVTNGGIHGVYMLCQALLEPGDEVIMPDPEWPPAAGNVLAAKGVPVGCPLHEARGWRYDLDELESKITAEDARPVSQLAEQPVGRRADARRSRAASRRSRGHAICG